MKRITPFLIALLLFATSALKAQTSSEFHQIYGGSPPGRSSVDLCEVGENEQHFIIGDLHQRVFIGGDSLSSAKHNTYLFWIQITRLFGLNPLEIKVF